MGPARQRGRISHGSVDLADAQRGGRVLSIFLRDITERERVSQALLASRDELTRLSNALLHVREQEKHIARELHDDLGQSLTALTMELAELETRLPPDDAELRGRVEAIRHLTGLTFTSLRRIAADLPHHARRSRTGGGGGMAGVELRLALRHRHRRPDRVDQGEPSKLVATALFRTVQEALTNIAKHAQATKVRVQLSCSATLCTLVVQDNGVGATPASLARKLPHALGLQGIREQVRLLHGDVSISTPRNGGFRLKAALPAQSPQPAPPPWEDT